MRNGSNATVSGSFQKSIPWLRNSRVLALLWDGHSRQAAVELSHPGLDEHCNESGEEHDTQTRVKQRVYSDNVGRRSELGREYGSRVELRII